MITNKKALREYLGYEKRLYGKKRPILFLPVLSESSIAWKYVCLLRYEEFYTNKHNRIMAFLFHFLKVKLGRKYSLNFPINVVGKGLLLLHPHNIMCNAKKIGCNFAIQFNCSIVAGGHNSLTPTIGDNVVMGVGSVVLGDVFVANGVAIGANSTVTKSFYEENVCIAGSPAKVISKNGSSTWGSDNKHFSSF